MVTEISDKTKRYITSFSYFINYKNFCTTSLFIVMIVNNTRCEFSQRVDKKVGGKEH